MTPEQRKFIKNAIARYNSSTSKSGHITPEQRREIEDVIARGNMTPEERVKFMEDARAKQLARDGLPASMTPENRKVISDALWGKGINGRHAKILLYLNSCDCLPKEGVLAAHYAKEKSECIDEIFLLPLREAFKTGNGDFFRLIADTIEAGSNSYADKLRPFLCEHIHTCGKLTVKEICDLITKNIGGKYEERHIRRTLDEIGIAYQNGKVGRPKKQRRKKL